MAKSRKRSTRRDSRPRKANRPLVAACLIVKDEEDVIKACLDSITPFVDEIVVHDTGSTDRTVEICESLGAKVIRGEWRDDFSWARNVAIDATDAEWVLSIDADEELVQTNYDNLRKLLRMGTVDGYRAQIHNISDLSGAVSMTHASIRLFRRSCFRFEGLIHETVQVIPSPPKRVVVDGGEMFELKHWGYMPQVMAAKGKAERNIKLAEASAEQAGTDRAILEVARAHSLGRNSEAVLENVEKIRRTEDPALRRQALNLGAHALLLMKRFDEAEVWIDECLELGVPNGMTTWLHGMVLTAMERWEEALVVTDVEMGEDLDNEYGVAYGPDAVLLLKATSLMALGRTDEGVEVMIEAARSGPIAVWRDLLKALHTRDEMHRAVPAFLSQDLEASSRRLRGILAELLALPIEVGDSFAEAIWEASPGDPHAMAFISLAAPSLSLERAIVWEQRARSMGLMDSCPLLLKMVSDKVSAPQRIVAAALATEMFEAPTGPDALMRAAGELENREVLEATYTLGELAPSQLIHLVNGVVVNQERALVMAESLAALNAQEQAAEVLRMGLGTPATFPESTGRLERRLGQLEAAGAA